MLSTPLFRILHCFSLVVAISGMVLADSPSISSVIPGLGQRGTEFDVTIEGSGLDDECQLVFYRSGISCKSVRVNEGKLVATLVATETCERGIHPFHVSNKEGLSRVGVVKIVDQVLVDEVEPNDSSDAAQVVKPGSSVVGLLGVDDVDRYKVRLEQGERFSAEVEAIRLGAKLIDVKLSLYGNDGTLLLSVDDTPLGKQDPYLSFVASETGDFFLHVEASGVEGSDTSVYSLHLSNAPRPDFVYPPGGPLAEQIEVDVLGDAAIQWRQTVTFSEPGMREFFPTYESMAPVTPIPFQVANFGNVLEREPNNDIKQALAASEQPANTPIALNGVISQIGDIDVFPFRAEAGKSLKISVFGNRVASPIDTIVRIFSKSGRELSSNDDHAGLDSELVWLPPATDDYLLSVQEKRNAGGERYVYRVEIVPVAPTVVAFLPKRQDETTAHSIVVPQGNRVLQFVGVRRERWGGEAEIDFPSLPDGVKAFYGRVPAHQYAIPVVFEADEMADVSTSFLTVKARAFEKSPTIEGGFEHAIDLIAASADRLYQGLRVDRLPVSVVRPASVRVEMVSPPCSIPRDGKIGLQVKAERLDGFNGEVRVKIPFLPEWVDGPDEVTIPSDQTSAEIILQARPEAEQDSWPFVAVARAVPTVVSTEEADEERPQGGQGRRRRSSGASAGIEVSSRLLSIAIAESPLSSPANNWLSSPGSTLKVTFPLTQVGDVPESLNCVLQGLPPRVTAKDVTIDGKSENVTFEVTLQEDAPLGEFSTLVCELSGQLSGHNITYNVARGSSLKIVRSDELFFKDNGEPLSALEILRKQPIDASTFERRANDK